MAEIINPAVSNYRNLSVLATGVVVSAAPAYLMTLHVKNRDGTNEHTLKIYNKATAPDENDTPIFSIPVAAGGSDTLDFTVEGLGAEDEGAPFDAGISLRATTEIADNGTTAPTANDVVVNLTYRTP